MENTEEKLEQIEQLIEVFISKQKLIEEKLDTLIKNRPANYEEKSDKILELIAQQKNAESFSVIRQQIQILVEKSARAPEIIPVRHHHNFDFKARPYFTGAAVIAIMFVLSLSCSLYLFFQNRQIATDAEKFLVLKGNQPNLAFTIDSLYLLNREVLLKQTEERILERERLILAGEKERKTKADYNRAKAENKALKRKSLKKSK